MDRTLEIELNRLSTEAYGIEAHRKIADIIVYEAADVLRDTIRIEDYPDIEELYRRQAFTSLGDVIAMSQLLCSRLRFDFQEVYREGCKRAIDRCKEKLEGKDGF